MAQEIMVVKPFDKIIGKTTTETMNIMTEKMAKMVSAVKMTARGGGKTRVLGTSPRQRRIQNRLKRHGGNHISNLKASASEQTHHGIFNTI